MVTVQIDCYAPWPTFFLDLPAHLQSEALTDIMSPLCPPSEQSLSLYSGRLLPANATVGALASRNGDPNYLHVRLSVCLCGGKGGFGSQLRAAGGRMSSQKATNNDSCRTLDGRRLFSVKEAQKLATYLETVPSREAARRESAKKRLEDLKRDINNASSEVNISGPSKARLNDNFVEKSREIVDNVRGAVATGMLKKRKRSTIGAGGASAINSQIGKAVDGPLPATA